MSKPVSTGDLFQGGRIDAYNPDVGLSFIRYAQIIDPADNGLEFNFPNAQAAGNTFGRVCSIFVDNSLNAYELRVTVAGTRQTFPIPAQSTGVYNVDSQLGSTILVESAGLSAGVVEVIFYNYPQTPFVWYKNGSTISAAVTIANGADVALGSTTDPAITNPATNGTLIAYTRGILTRLSSLVTGVVLAAGTAIIGKVSPLTSATLGATQVTVPATANGILLRASNAARTGAMISNPGPLTLYISSAATGLTITNGFGIPSGGVFNINSPLYTGAIYGIVSAGTQVATTAEFT